MSVSSELPVAVKRNERKIMNLGNILAYVDFAIELIAAVQSVLHLGISATNPLTAAQLETIAAPVIAGVQALVPKANIPGALVTDVANGIADAVNAFYHPAA